MDPNDDHRQEYNKLHQQQIAVTKLLDAVKGSNRKVLAERLEDCREAEVKRDNPTYRKGRLIYRLIDSLKRDLEDALSGGRHDDIEDAILHIRASEVERFLKEDASQAEQSLTGARFPRFPNATIGLNKAAMSEMRTYYNPSSLVRNVMSATLLLLDEDEEKTSKWSYVVSKSFPASLNRRILEFNPNRLDEKIKDRAQYLLKNASLAKIRKSCPGVAGFYVWTREIVGGESDDEEDAEERLSKLEKDHRSMINENLRCKRGEKPRHSKEELDNVKKDIDKMKKDIAREKKREQKKLQEAIRMEKELYEEREKEEKIKRVMALEAKSPTLKGGRRVRENGGRHRGVSNNNNYSDYNYSPTSNKSHRTYNDN